MTYRGVTLADERQHGLNFRGRGRPEAAWGADVPLPGAQPPVQVRSGMALLRFVVDVVGGGGGGVAVVGLASIFVRRVISHPSPFLTYVCVQKKSCFCMILFASAMVFNHLNRVHAYIRPLCTSGGAT